MKLCYKIFECIKYKIDYGSYEYLYKTLHHGCLGTRIVHEGMWLKAENKLVRENSRQNYYLSGWHCFENKKIAEKYIKKFKNNDQMKIVPILAKGLRKKKTNKDVILANNIFIIPNFKIEWN